MQDADTQQDRAVGKNDAHGEAHAHDDAHAHGHHHHHDEPMTSEEAVRSLLLLGQVSLDAEDYESAIEAYASVLKLEQNETAAYNLASLHARGLGVKRNYVEAGRLFRQAELLGNEQAGKLCAKCMMDFVCAGLLLKEPAAVYASMAIFVGQVYPEATAPRQEVNSGLYAIASTLLNKGSYTDAAKVFRAGAEFGDDAYAQCYLGELYAAGAGVGQDELVALYWLDRAVGNGAAAMAREDRDNILNGLRQGLSADEFAHAMTTLAGWCEGGTDDIPTDRDAAARWRALV